MYGIAHTGHQYAHLGVASILSVRGAGRLIGAGKDYFPHSEIRWLDGLTKGLTFEPIKK